MYKHVTYMFSWGREKLKERLGERGAEMVEYAIVLACIAAVAVIFYTTTRPKYATDNYNGEVANTLSGALDYLWNQIKIKVTGKN